MHAQDPFAGDPTNLWTALGRAGLQSNGDGHPMPLPTISTTLDKWDGAELQLLHEQCLLPKENERPSMAEVLSHLQSIKARLAST